jgi:hypothetical protein
LSLDQSPALGAVLRYFLATPLFALLAGNIGTVALPSSTRPAAMRRPGCWPNVDIALQAVKEAQAIATEDGFSDVLIEQHYAAAEYAAALNDFATACAEYKAGHACEQRLYGKAPLERSQVPQGWVQP